MSALSLRRSLLWRLGTLMLVFSVVSSAVVYRLSLGFSDEAYDEWLLDSARSLAQLVQAKDDGLTVDLPASTLQAVIFDARDRVLFRIDSAREGLIAGQTALKPGPADADVRYSTLVVEGQAMRAVQFTRRDLQADNPVTITVAETLHKRTRLASRVLGTVMAISGILGLLTVFFARDAVTRGLRPLLDLSATVRARRHGDLTLLPDAGVAQELATFTQAINGLLSQLDQAVQHQRRFVADAAHQLRTPLAALRVELEHARREADPVRHHAALDEMRDGIERLSRLANQLLTLARAEPGALANTAFRLLDLHALVHEATGRHLHTGLQRGADLGFEGEAHPQVMGDALLLQEAVNNLLDNALRYAGPHALITVRVRHQPGTPAHPAQAVIEVEDNGPGVPQTELPRLTERFHRPPGSPAGGSGLGLSIVHEIAHLHQGTLAIEPVQPHGLLVRINLPAQA